MAASSVDTGEGSSDASDAEPADAQTFRVTTDRYAELWPALNGTARSAAQYAEQHFRSALTRRGSGFESLSAQE